MLDKNGNPKVALHIENEMRWAMKKYRKLHPDKPFPHITPHVFRHTFCTNYANAGMKIPDLQYLMGHSDAGVTLNVYTHASYAHAADQMAKIIEFRQKSDKEKEKRRLISQPRKQQQDEFHHPLLHQLTVSLHRFM